MIKNDVSSFSAKKTLQKMPYAAQGVEAEITHKNNNTKELPH